MTNEMLVEATREVLFGMSPEEVVAVAVAIGLFLFVYGFVKEQTKGKKMKRNLNECNTL